MKTPFEIIYELIIAEVGFFNEMVKTSEIENEVEYCYSKIRGMVTCLDRINESEKSYNMKLKSDNSGIAFGYYDENDNWTTIFE